MYNINFQEGKIEEVGRNGLYIEEALKKCIERILKKNVGKFICSENLHAVANIQKAIACLQERQERIKSNENRVHS